MRLISNLAKLGLVGILSVNSNCIIVQPPETSPPQNTGNQNVNPNPSPYVPAPTTNNPAPTNTGGNTSSPTPTPQPTTRTQRGRLTPIEDSYVDSCHIERNYGSDSALQTGMVSFPDGSDCRNTAFIKFEPGYIPSGARITRAELILTTLPSPNEITGNVTLAYVTNTSWNEGTLTYVTSPTSGTSIATREVQFSFRNPPTISFDVKNTLQGLVNGTIENRGFMIKTRNLEGYGSRAEIYSKDSLGGNMLEEPRIEYTYEIEN